MTRRREEILEGSRQLRAEYGEVFDAAAALLFREHPIDISFDNPHTDEYEPEAGLSCRG
jgi:hypothetical protein